MLTAEPIIRASGLSLRQFRETVRASTKSIDQARRGPMSLSLADAWCCRIGRHPAEVYGVRVWLHALGAERV